MNDDISRDAEVEESRPVLRRYRGILGGVAAGLAHRFDLAPWIVRLGFVVLAFFGGLGILLYLAGWLLIPAEGSDRAIAERWLGDLGTERSWIGAVLIALAAIWIVTSLDIARPGLAWAVALLVLGVLLYRNEPPRRAAPDPAPDESGTSLPSLPPSPATRRRRPARRTRPPSMLGRYTLAAGLIGLGVFAWLDAAGVIFPDARHYLALAVAITGVGLLIGSVWGRSRTLIAGGLVLSFLLGIAAVGNTVEAIENEQRRYVPQSVAEVDDRYEMRRGTLIIDLSQLDPAGAALEVAGDLGAGELRVILPHDVGADIQARVGAGEVRVLGRSSEGLGVGRSVTLEGSRGRIDLHLRVGAGVINVTQEAGS